MDGISDTNTEEQILLCIDVLTDDVRSLRTDVKDAQVRLGRVETDVKDVQVRLGRVETDVKEIKGRFDGVESDIKEIKETLLEMNGRS